MNYGDFTLEPEPEYRLAAIDTIFERFKIGSDDISRACNVGGVEYPSLVWSYLFIARCIDAGREIEDKSSDEELEIETAEMVEEESQSVMPYTNYSIWMVWVDLGFNAPDMSITWNDSELIEIPQMSLYETAERIIWSEVL